MGDDIKKPTAADMYEVCGGSIIGRDHVLLGKNNQDAFYHSFQGPHLVAVVCDGCGSGKYNEYGAQMFAKLTTEIILGNLNSGYQQLGNDLWEQCHFDLTRAVRQTAALLQGNETYVRHIVENYLLFTIMGVAISPDSVTVFSIGDGVSYINGIAGQPKKFDNNAPPYLGYMVFDKLGGWDRHKLEFDAPFTLSTDGIKSVFIGTDGVEALIPALESSGEKLEQFWTNDRYYKNVDAVRRRLSLINKGGHKVNWETREVIKHPQPLNDDTTFIAIRRKTCPTET